jgi:hypothetical protein
MAEPAAADASRGRGVAGGQALAAVVAALLRESCHGEVHGLGSVVVVIPASADFTFAAPPTSSVDQRWQIGFRQRRRRDLAPAPAILIAFRTFTIGGCLSARFIVRQPSGPGSSIAPVLRRQR